MSTSKRVAFLLAVALGAGIAGGLVLSGRLALTSPSSAEPPQGSAASSAGAAVGVVTNGAPGGLPDLSTVAERALHVSVSISSTTTVQVDPFWQMFYGNRAQTSQSTGSGVIVTPDGYILTNTHVIGAPNAAVRVTLEDGRDRPAKLVGIDAVSDLAVVKIDADNLETLPWGDSSKLRVAEWVLAVGNPFQLSGTVTLGIVSTRRLRSADQVGSYQDFIQTDAAINPGNSGGALINARGELVGINTMIYSETGGNVGIGFAIPSNAARQIMTGLIRDGVITRGTIGDPEFVTITSAMAARYRLEFTGAFVRSLMRDSPAYQAGLRPGDTIVSVNGQRVSDREQIERAVVLQPVGSRLRVEVVNQDGRQSTLEIPVVARQTNPRRPSTTP